MSRKRRNTSSPEPDESSPAKRRPSSNLYRDDVGDVKEQPQLHQDVGQVGAFPGLGDGDKPFYGPALDGIDYLRMVRSEAKGVPTLLSAAVEQAAEEQSTFRKDGRYSDGVYAAKDNAQDEGVELPIAQKRYYEILLAQFRVVQATLRCTPPLEAIQALGDTRPISFPSKSSTAGKAWERHVFRHDPHPSQIACMDLESVFELVQLMRKLLRHFASYSSSIKTRIGAWVWASIGKLPDRGELGADEIACVRALATTATATLDEDVQILNDDSDDGENDDLVEIGSMIEAAMQAETIGVKDEPATATYDETETHRSSTAALLEMILTVVGEIYGQQDLLELRPIWNEQCGQPG